MKRVLIFISILSFALMLSPVSAAESPKFTEEFSNADSDKALKNIAAILYHMEHYVVSNDKRMLKAMYKNEKLPTNIRTIAQAIVNIQHKPLYDDIEKLENIFRNENAKASEQELALIVSQFRFKPTSKDKRTLKLILQ